MFRKVILIIFSLLMLSSCAGLSEPGRIYKTAQIHIGENNLDGAFMELRQLLRYYPDSIFTKDARFAVAEYFFIKKTYYDSLAEFSSFLADYPESPDAIFAKAICYKIISEFKDKDLEQISSKIRKQFFSKPILLIFSEYKTKKFITPLGSQYLIKEHIDRVEIFKDNEIFLEITP